MPFFKSKISFYAKTGEQSLLVSLVHVVSQNQIQNTAVKKVKSVHELLYLMKSECLEIQSGYQGS